MNKELITIPENNDSVNRKSKSIHIKYTMNDIDKLRVKYNPEPSVNNPVSVYSLKMFLNSEAMSNLYKQTKFLKLYINFIEESITEEEFEVEVNSNSDKYFIKLKELKSIVDINALKLAINEFHHELNFDEISEIFGIENNSLKQLQLF